MKISIFKKLQNTSNIKHVSTPVLHFLYTTIPLISGGASKKRLVLVRSEVLGQFVKTMTSDYKYFR